MRCNAIVFAAVISLLFSVIAAAQSDPREGPIRDLIKRHFEAIEKEEIDDFLLTIHPRSPQYNNTETLMRRIFEANDLSYEWRILKIDIKAEALAYVEIEQTTKRVSGRVFRNNYIRYRNELRKYDGKWKIFNTIFDEIKYLN